MKVNSMSYCSPSNNKRSVPQERTLSHPNKNLAFKGDGDGSGCILQVGLVLSIVLNVVSIMAHDNRQSKLAGKLLNIYQSPEIKKDTFTVKDVTGDEEPDLILYKKDGTRVVYDIKNEQLLQETKNISLEELE